jgi:hypothetical protein
MKINICFGAQIYSISLVSFILQKIPNREISGKGRDSGFQNPAGLGSRWALINMNVRNVIWQLCMTDTLICTKMRLEEQFISTKP